MASNIDTDKIARDIARLMEKARREADPQLLSEYRGLFKKNVSFFDRSLAAAYLLMLYEQGFRDNRFHPQHGDKNRDNRRPRQETDRQDEPKNYPLSEEESTRLFFSIGRSRRVYPREILGMITNRCGIAREDVGAIRILDNYSFVQVRTSVAADIIETLNGIDFRGRSMTVNYARSRQDADAETGAEAAAEAAADATAEAADEKAADDTGESWSDTASDSRDLHEGDDGAYKDGVSGDTDQQ